MADKKKPLSIVVTGGSGFLGSNTVEALLTQHPDWHITILDLNPPPTHLASRIHQYIPVDITSEDNVRAAFATLSPDLVVHSAGIVPARSSRYSTRETDWQRVKAINYDGTRHILDASLARGCRRFVYTSSCTVIIDDLDHDYHNVTECAVELGRAKLHYGRSKALAETYVLAPQHVEEHGLQACALRPSTIIGEGDTAVIGVMHDLIAKGETNFIVGDGDNFYDFVYISNAVQAHVLAVENLLSTSSSSSEEKNPTAAGHAFNISNQEPVYFWDFLAFIWAQFGHEPRFRVRIPVNIAWFAGLLLEWWTFVTRTAPTLDRGSVKDGVRTHYADCSKANEILGYRPTVGLAEGVRRSCEFYKGVLAQKEKVK